jgi:hypothetical protein
VEGEKGGDKREKEVVQRPSNAHIIAALGLAAAVISVYLSLLLERNKAWDNEQG